MSKKLNNNKKTLNKLKIGGMATFNGVLLKSNTKQVVTSQINDNIQTDICETSSSKLISAIPILRGISGLFSSISSGIPYIVESAENIVNDIVKDKTEKIVISKFELLVSFIISFFIFSLLWVSVPMVASLILPNTDFRYIIQITVKLLMFAIYVTTIKKISYLNELFEYHGAEHTAVNYYEDNVKEVNNIKSILDINLDKVASYSRFHRRCGSNYIMHLLFLSLLTTAILPSTDIVTKIIIEIFTFPVLMGLAYETLNLSTLLPKKFNFILVPFMYVQNITTKKPSKDKLLIGVTSLLEITTKHITVEGYIKQYINKYLKKFEVNQNDILRIVSYALNIDKNNLFVNLDNIHIGIPEQIKIKKLLDRYYIDYEPLQYILGIQSFYNEEYIVNHDVLIPRADSEILVETAIKYIKQNNFKTGIDMCTGSGAIGISIAKNSDIDNMLLVDISDRALIVTNKNIVKNNVVNKCSSIKSDLFKTLPEDIKYDIIVTNPPYIKAEELMNLSNYVKKEPMIALNGGKSGLDIYERIFKEVQDILINNGYIILEIGYDQKQDIINLISNYPNYEYIECIQDLGLKDRVIVCHFHQI
ncbi:MAG: protein-(glutamine-N5) methyltransferase, release factor-specific [Clostridia bacterium]|jgi:release factor-specific protein-(glutamine-N5) methyltransferase|nr:protein-(glutamine-N5) methyltransferase, release factor-specific [Clostridia bacterium]